jgi:hypothetical protein
MSTIPESATVLSVSFVNFISVYNPTMVAQKPNVECDGFGLTDPFPGAVGS